MPIQRVEVDLDGVGVIVTWWETGKTSDVPVMRVNNDNGRTFEEKIMLVINGSIRWS